jgi:hypothetical protein
VAPLTKEQLDALRDTADQTINTARRLCAEAQRQLEALRKATEQHDTERDNLRERGRPPASKSD